MCPTVSRQIGCLRERLVALVAAIRPLARMCSHVGFQRTRSRIPKKICNSECHENQVFLVIIF